MNLCLHLLIGISIVKAFTSSHFDRASRPDARRSAFDPSGATVGWLLLVGLAILLLVRCSSAQEEKPKIPGLDKIISRQ